MTKNKFRALFESGQDHVVEKLLRRCLSRGVVRFTFKKANGQERLTNATTNLGIIGQAQGTGVTFKNVSKAAGAKINFFDLDVLGWRSCYPGDVLDILDEDPEYAARFDAPAIQADGSIETAPQVDDSTVDDGESPVASVQSLSSLSSAPKVFVDSDQTYHGDDLDTDADPVIGGNGGRAVVNTSIDSGQVYSELMFFRFRLYTTYDPNDGFWVWTTAYSATEAADQILSEYWGVLEATLYEIKPYVDAKVDGQASSTDKSLQSYVGADGKYSDNSVIATDRRVIEDAEAAGLTLDGEYQIYDMASVEAPDAVDKAEMLRRLLHKGLVHFKYEKADGTIRQALGTTCMELIRQDFQPSSYKSGVASTRNKSKDTMRYFDVQSMGWRSCRVANLIFE